MHATASRITREVISWLEVNLSSTRHILIGKLFHARMPSSAQFPLVSRRRCRCCFVPPKDNFLSGIIFNQHHYTFTAVA